MIFRGVNYGGSLFFGGGSRVRLRFLLCPSSGSDDFFPSGLPFPADLLVIKTRILSSKVEYLSVRLYNFSIMVGGSNDNEWKNRVDDTKLFLKF